MDLHQEFVTYGSLALKWRRKCELLLSEIDRKQIWKKKNYASIYEYAAKLAGMSKARVDDCLRIHRHIEDKPALLEVANKKGLSAVRPVATISTREDAGFWADKAINLPKNALEKYVQTYRANSCPRTESQPEKVQIVIDLDSATAAKLQKMKGDLSWNEFISELMHKEKPERVKTESRYIPAEIKKYVLSLSGGKCAQCSRKADVLHHADRFAHSHEHNPDTLLPLCEGHHQLAHLGYIVSEQDAFGKWRVRDRAEPSALDLKWCSYQRG